MTKKERERKSVIVSRTELLYSIGKVGGLIVAFLNKASPGWKDLCT